MRVVRQRMQRLFPMRLKLGGAGQQPFLGIGFQRGDPGGRGDGVARVGIAVEQLDHMFRTLHEGVVDRRRGQDSAHRDDAVRQPLGAGDHVGHHAEVLRREGRAETAEARDDLVEDQQDAVLARDVAQAFQIALGRQQDTGRARHRFHDHGGDGIGAVQRDDALQFVGQMRAMFRLPARHAVFRQMRMGQVVHPGQQAAEDAAVADDAAHRDAAEAHAVIPALAPDQARPAALAARAVIGQCDLQRGIHRLGARVGVEHMLQPLGRDVDDPVGEFERARMAHLECRRIVQRAHHPADRLGDARPAMTGVAAPEPCGPVQDLAPVRRRIVHVLRRDEHPGRLLELPVRGEGHPEGAQVVRRGLAVQWHRRPRSGKARAGGVAGR